MIIQNIKHKHIIIFRGCMNLSRWNKMLRILYDKKIQYKCDEKLSPTRDDAGLLKYYSRIKFSYSKYLPLNIITREYIL